MEIVHIPVKHCVLKPIELVWAGLKNFVRNRNVRFSLNGVEQLTKEMVIVMGPEDVGPYFDHVKKHEEIFKAADKIAGEMDNDLIDDDDADNNLIDIDSSDSD
ncbi:unnamed protein product [Didymodactylos carnosus]|uniref:Uncharacterized protein n=1 Tax=Didymodactylos carnosus TaxID=1234261 RepID=A0A815YA94_9BILA|nr:unnamed protein product [Didymodactylos carnosus]CAF1568310.1 unnamed protein product [Didymodactylos carnosus]CAF4333286.1 unnamed protein product [Didymodactylos carnosus]CAF4430833.1 unnamed protein product [Didymodactylos carnosus]